MGLIASALERIRSVCTVENITAGTEVDGGSV